MIHHYHEPARYDAIHSSLLLYILRNGNPVESNYYEFYFHTSDSRTGEETMETK